MDPSNAQTPRSITPATECAVGSFTFHRSCFLTLYRSARMPQLLDLPPQIFQRGTNNPVLLYRVHHPRTPGTSIVPFEDAYWMNTDDEILSIVEHIEDGFCECTSRVSHPVPNTSLTTL